MRFHTIYTVLRKNIENKFKIKYHGKAWHTEESTDSDGNTTQTTVTTFNETYEYKFQSGADYSVFNINSSDIDNKRYFDLEIEYEYMGLDVDTSNDEKKAYSDFYDRANCDEHFFVEKLVPIKGTHSKNIIPFCKYYIIILDRLIFLICILLSLGQIFKYVISCFMSKKTIKITKIISNHYDLTQSDSFFSIQPKINLFGEDIKYDREKFTFKNSEGLEIMISSKYPLNSNFSYYDSKNNNNNVFIYNKIENTNIGDIYEDYSLNNNDIDIDINKKLELEKLIQKK